MALLLLASAFASGCAAQHTFAELGYPPYADGFPPQTRVTLARGVTPESGEIRGWVGDETPPSSLTYRAIGQTHAYVDGDDVICEVRAGAGGDAKVASLLVLAYGLTDADAARYQVTGRVPDPTAVLTRGRSDKPEPDGDWLVVAFRLPKKKLDGKTRIALPYLVLFRQNAILVKTPQIAIPR